MAEEVSLKSSKVEILKAYDDLLKQVKEEKSSDKREQRVRAEKQELVQKAGGLTMDSIIGSLAAVKLEVGKAFDQIEAKLLENHKELDGLEKAIAVEKEGIEQIHEIMAEADSLAALIKAQQQKKSDFEQEMQQAEQSFDENMEEKRIAWKQEEERMTQIVKDRKLQIEKERKQEEEEFIYQRDRQRKLEQDAYEAGKAALEKEILEKREAFERDLKARMEAVALKETEYAELKAKAGAFPAELQKQTAEAKANAVIEIEQRYQHEISMLKKEMESEQKLHQQMVSMLEAKIKENDAQLTQLAAKADTAGKQVQEIAVKAIEGAAKSSQITREIYQKVQEKDK